jgi:hypothetical protein
MKTLTIELHPEEITPHNMHMYQWLLDTLRMFGLPIRHMGKESPVMFRQASGYMLVHRHPAVEVDCADAREEWFATKAAERYTFQLRGLNVLAEKEKADAIAEAERKEAEKAARKAEREAKAARKANRATVVPSDPEPFSLPGLA